MARLIYTAITSLDGYIADAQGSFDWSMPDEDVHQFVNDLERQVGTYVYGRLMYEVMVAWETMETEGPSDAVRDYSGIWRSAEKIVCSTTLDAPSSERTRIERDFNADTIKALKKDSERDISIGGPHIAAAAIRAGLVDEFRRFVSPVVVGGGNQMLPDGIRVHLELLDEHRFANGVVYLSYRVKY